MGDEGVELGETFFAHAQRRAKAVKPLVDEVLIVMRYHLLRLLMQGCSWESLDLQQERFAQVTCADARRLKSLHQADKLGDFLGGDG